MAFMKLLTILQRLAGLSPTQDQKDALKGTAGIANDDNRYVTNEDSRIPTADEKDALAGTAGHPDNTNRFVTEQDGRFVSKIIPRHHIFTDENLTDKEAGKLMLVYEPEDTFGVSWDSLEHDPALNEYPSAAHTIINLYLPAGEDNIPSGSQFMISQHDDMQVVIDFSPLVFRVDWAYRNPSPVLDAPDAVIIEAREGTRTIAQFAVCNLTKIDENRWLLEGDLEPNV